MFTSITNDIKVTVETFYQDSASYPDSGHFVFAYRIIVENNSENTIKLMRRHWFIVDSNSIHREVEGEGVVGQQPVIEPYKSYQYVSGCNLQTDMGKMYGTYLIERIGDGSTFEVTIPEFCMIVPYKSN